MPHTDPLEPNTGYLAHLADETDARTRQSTAPESPFAGAPEEPSDAVESAAESLPPELDHVVAALHTERGDRWRGVRLRDRRRHLPWRFPAVPADACQIDPSTGRPIMPPGATIAPEIGQQLFTLREGFDHPIIGTYLDLAARNGIKVLAVEFIESTDGRLLTYDVNTNTNYNANVNAVAPRSAPAALVDYLVRLASEATPPRRNLLPPSGSPGPRPFLGGATNASSRASAASPVGVSLGVSASGSPACGTCPKGSHAPSAPRAGFLRGGTRLSPRQRTTTGR